MSRPSDIKSIVYVHLPKTGGTTLKSIIYRQYPPAQIYAIKAPFDQGVINRFVSLPEDKRMKLKVLMGHNTDGLHIHMRQPCAYITMLRHPVAWCISYYYFASYTPTNRYHDEIRKGMKIEDFAYELRNFQTNGISRQVSVDKLEYAKDKVKHTYAVTGITERFDETVLLMARVFDWHRPFYYRLTVNKVPYSIDDVSVQTRDRIKEIYDWDMDLYEYANSLLDEKIAAIGESFKREYEEFARSNANFQDVVTDIIYSRKKLQDDLERLQASFSWKITKPIRILGSLFKK